MGISPKTMNEIFQFSNNSVYSLRNEIQLEKPSINTVQFGSGSMSTMQNILQLGWFCKLITSCWSAPLPYCFL